MGSPIARTLLEGSINTLELTLRTPTAFESLAAIRQLGTREDSLLCREN